MPILRADLDKAASSDIALFLVLETGGYDEQLAAIRNLLAQRKLIPLSAEEQSARKASFAGRVGPLGRDHMVDAWNGFYQQRVYEDAAYSMAAAGMLVPLIETIFREAFNGIGRLVVTNSIPLGPHPRWQWLDTEQWDCQLYCSVGGRPDKDFVFGVCELVETAGLAPYLTPGFAVTLDAIFCYRDNMIPRGFKWSEEDLNDFAREIDEERWPYEWFRLSIIEMKPWIYYMTGDLINQCILMIEDFLRAVGDFARDKLLLI